MEIWRRPLHLDVDPTVGVIFGSRCKVLVCTFNQEKALVVGASSVIVTLCVDLRLKLYAKPRSAVAAE